MIPPICKKHRGPHLCLKVIKTGKDSYVIDAGVRGMDTRAAFAIRPCDSRSSSYTRRDIATLKKLKRLPIRVEMM